MNVSMINELITYLDKRADYYGSCIHHGVVGLLCEGGQSENMLHMFESNNAFTFLRFDFTAKKRFKKDNFRIKSERQKWFQTGGLEPTRLL